jgi:hypothetical protein
VRAWWCWFALVGCVEPNLVPCPPPTNQDLCPPSWLPIEYPDADMNVLSKTTTVYVLDTLMGQTFTADMHTNHALSIRITGTNGTTCGAWSFSPMDTGDFTVADCVDRTMPGPATFTTTRDGVVVLPNFRFGDLLMHPGSATIEYLEYGSDTPQFSKQVTWAP